MTFLGSGLYTVLAFLVVLSLHLVRLSERGAERSLLALEIPAAFSIIEGQRVPLQDETFAEARGRMLTLLDPSQLEVE